MTSLASFSTLNANENSITLGQKASYNQYIDYSYSKQSTIDNSLLKNDKTMLKDIEIFEIDKIIKNKYGVKITNIWLPANDNLKKICLFVTLENQENLISKFDDFELDLYLTLEDKLKQSQLFNMIALI
jgi:hypothetical protein